MDGWSVDRIVSEEVQSGKAAHKKHLKQSGERERMDREIDPNRAVDFIRDNGKVYAKAKADRVYMEEYRKTVKAQMMTMYNSLPVNAQEREAYRSKTYIDHLKAMQEAVYQDELNRWGMVAATSTIEAWRTQNANRRGEGKLQ